MTNANDWVHQMAVGNVKTPPLTKFELFVSNAPDEIPNWFIHVSAPQPKKPKHWSEFDEVHQEIVRQWLQDGVFNLPDELTWYQEQWHEYNDNRQTWERKDKESRYFQWRIYYAKQMINELNKQQ